jgi:hypothetical protein
MKKLETKTQDWKEIQVDKLIQKPLEVASQISSKDVIVFDDGEKQIVATPEGRGDYCLITLKKLSCEENIFRLVGYLERSWIDQYIGEIKEGMENIYDQTKKIWNERIK